MLVFFLNPVAEGPLVFLVLVKGILQGTKQNVGQKCLSRNWAVKLVENSSLLQVLFRAQVPEPTWSISQTSGHSLDLVSFLSCFCVLLSPAPFLPLRVHLEYTILTSLRHLIWIPRRNAVQLSYTRTNISIT